MQNWTGIQDLYIPDVLNCGLSTVKNVGGNYTEVFEITKDAHQSQTIRNIQYTHYQLEATSTKGWLNGRKIHVYMSNATGGHTIITYDFGRWRYIYENVSTSSVNIVHRTFNMSYL